MIGQCSALILIRAIREISGFSWTSPRPQNSSRSWLLMP